MKLTGIGIGLAERDGLALYGVTPHSGLTVARVPKGAPPAAEIAASLRHALTFGPPDWRGLEAVTVRADADGIAYTIVDHRGGLRQVLMGPAGALPKMIELDPTGLPPATFDAMQESLQKRLSEAGGFARPELFGAALAKIDPIQSTDLDADETAYVEAQRRADALAQAVRSLDDQMTASVVPDWIWIATGAGGIGVLLTVIALLYPELRVILIFGLILTSIVGFGLYGYRAYGEQKVRARLLVARAERRTEREAARAIARDLASQLRAGGGDPDGALLGSAATEVATTVPGIVGMAEASPAILEAYARLGRQIVVIADKVQSGLNEAWILEFLRERPSE